jgi:hypothetical protein
MKLGKQTDVIYTDFNNAYDTINHSIIVDKLSSYGITNNFLS